MKSIKISVHPLYILLGIFLFLMGSGYAFISYTITIILHEFSHAEVAYRLGFAAGDIQLMPYGARLTGAFKGLRTSDEILIAAAGPIFNAIIAVIFTALFWLIPSIYFFAEAFAIANLVTCVFNLIPVFPLDGGRIFLALLTSKLGRKRALQITQRVGLILGLLFICAFIVSLYFAANLTLVTIGLFMLVSALTTRREAPFRRIIERTYRYDNIKRGLTVREILVTPDMTLAEISRLIYGLYYFKITIVDSSLNQLATLTETKLDDLMTQYDLNTKIGSIKTDTP